MKLVYFYNMPIVGHNETFILDSIEYSNKFKVLRQYSVDGYYLDGYIPEINLAIEVDEKGHTRAKSIKKDINREEYIKNKRGCRFLRINDID